MSNSEHDILEKGLRGHSIDDLVEGWSFRIAEVSSNVYKMDGIDKKGHHISHHGVDIHKVIGDSIVGAKKINWFQVSWRIRAGGLLAKIFSKDRKGIIK